ncbi:hypothetical protein HaLaN_06784, partial [Haematococcus lacustris]
MLDAQSCKQPDKEMSRLRKFLFKNQEHRGRAIVSVVGAHAMCVGAAPYRQNTIRSEETLACPCIDSEQGHLFQAVQLHVTAALAAAVPAKSGHGSANQGGGCVAAAAALSL